MPELAAEPSLRAYLQSLRKRRWWVIACALAGLGLSLAVSLTGQKQYSATAQLLVQASGGVNPGVGFSQNPVTTTDVQTELQLITSAQVEEQVQAKLGVVPAVSAFEVGQTDVIAVTAVSPAPARAALIANTYASAFVAARTAATTANLAAAENQLTGQIKAIGTEISRLPHGSTSQLSALSNQQAVLKGQLAQLEVAGSVASTGLEFVTPAQAPTAPSSPKPAQDALLGLLAGLALGGAVAFVLESLDDRLAGTEAVERASGAPVLATVPLVPSWRRNQAPAMVAASDPTSSAAEAYRSLRTSLQFARQDRQLRSLLVTSSCAGEGKTATVINLGAVFAQAGERVVIVSCDLRRPRLGLVPKPGEPAELSAVLAGRRSLDNALAEVPGMEGLWTLGTWTVTPNPTELLSGQRMRYIFAQLAERFDLVLIDSPPVLPVADAMILTAYADAVLLVVGSAQTRRGEFARTAEKLAQANAPVVGVVLNKATARDSYGGYGGYEPHGYEPHGYEPAASSRAKGNGLSRPSGTPGRHGR
jgi:capsular exopolysaccharide synthesis family protein